MSDNDSYYSGQNQSVGRHVKQNAQQQAAGRNLRQEQNVQPAGSTQRYNPSNSTGSQSYQRQTSAGQAASAGFKPATAGSGSYGRYNNGGRGQYGQARSPYTAASSNFTSPSNDIPGGGDFFNNQGNGHENLIKVRKKRRKAPRIILTVFIALLVLILAGAGALALWINSLDSSMSLTEEDEEALSQVLKTTDDDDSSAFYMLILGSDAREEDEASRSDVTMLVRIDPEAATVHLISIPRDTMVTIEGYGTQKINAAYAYGGAAGAVECVSEFAGVDISHYAEVHFEELEEVVDDLGGIWVNIPEDIEAGNGGMSFEAGEQLLDGEEALAFARERYNVTGGDFGRAQAQRLIVEALIDRVLSETPSELPSTISQLASTISTDYSVADLLSLAQQFIGEDVTVYSASCPSYTLNQDGVSYVATMFDEWQAMMQRVDAGLDPEDETAEIPEEQANNSELGAASNSPAPRDYEDLAASSLTTDNVASTDDDTDE